MSTLVTKSNLRKHELLGLFYQLISGTCFGLGVYYAFWSAVRPLYFNSLKYSISGKDYLIFPLFFGLSFVLWSLGRIELKEAKPGKKTD